MTERITLDRRSIIVLYAVIRLAYGNDILPKV